ncbi:MAG TPA: tetratricopeptide repeat protein [Deltaproteobacteria bacterium]|nr:tetratricopeptide repeat protein [Deltaproteobacteria bacterium]
MKGNSVIQKIVDRYTEIIVYILLIVSTAAVYSHVVVSDFVIIDDPLQVTQNANVLSGFSWDTCIKAFRPESWCSPITWVGYTTVYNMFGLNPAAFHLMNLLLHITSTILLLSLLDKMTGEFWKSAFVAALFAVHPVNVESVAWIAELNNVLSGLFFMLTLLAYTIYTRSPDWKGYLLTLVAFVFGLLAKPVLVTLPFIMLLLDLWPLRRIRLESNDDLGASVRFKLSGIPVSRLILEKVPFMILAFLSLASNVAGASKRMGLYSTEAVSIGLRMSNAIVSYVKYLGKIFWPVDLAVFYPYPSTVPLWQVAGASFVLILMTLLALRFVVERPYLLVGWLWFLGGLVPFLGLVQSGFWPELADRYAYLTYIGIFIAFAWGLSDLFPRLRPTRRILSGSAAVVVVVLMPLTWIQVSYWKDTETLFKQNISVTENNYLAHYNLGIALFEHGDIDGAIHNFRHALRIKPHDIMPRNNLGVALFKKKDIEGAIREYRECIRINPNHHLAYFNLAQAYREKMGLQEAVEWYLKGLRISPNDIQARNSLGDLFLSMGNNAEAIVQYNESLKINLHQPYALYNLGRAYLKEENYRKAAESFQRALEQNPNSVEASQGLESARGYHERLSAVIAQLKEMIRNDPGNVSLYIKLGDIYNRQDDHGEAINQYRKALSIRPGTMQIMYGLVLIYSDMKDYSKALDLLQDIRRIQPDNPEVDYNIACIYSKQGMKDDSVRWLQNAVDKGFHNWGLIMKDPDLAAIRNTDVFKGFMNEHDIN